MQLKEYDEKRIEFIFKRIDTLHKSVLKKLTIFTVVILNIYFTKLWSLYTTMFDKIIEWVEVLLSNHIPILDALKIPTIISYTLYGTEIGLALLTVFIWMYFATFELIDIKRLEKELKRYDLHFNINIRNIEDDQLFKRLENILLNILKKT